MERGAQKAELVGACLTVFGDIGGDQEQASGQDPQGDERVSGIANPAEEERAGAENNEIESKSSFFQQELSLFKGPLDGGFFPFSPLYSALDGFPVFEPHRRLGGSGDEFARG